MRNRLVIGTRGSALALWQAKYVAKEIETAFSNLSVDLQIFKTKGDHILDRPLAEIGGKGLFTKELEVALLAGEIDLAVHSLKDMPTEFPEGLVLAATPRRADIRDCLVTRIGDTLAPKVVGTASLRRMALGQRRLPDATFRSIRGNVETRMNKLFAQGDERCDAVILANAGLQRLALTQNREDVAFLPMNPEVFIPAAGQGALAIECREADAELRTLLDHLNDPFTRICITAERSFLAGVEGSCRVPVGAYATNDGENIRLKCFVSSVCGQQYLDEIVVGKDAERLGREAAQTILGRGGREILDAL